MKFFKRSLRLVPILIILIVLPRVSNFVRSMSPAQDGIDVHDLISVAFALTLGLGTVASSYFTRDEDPPDYDDEPTNPRERRRREREMAYYATMKNAVPAARVATVFFGVFDGAFNLADAVAGATEVGLLDIGGWRGTVNAIAVVMFGLGPTILAIVSAWVNSLIDRIPEDFEKPITKKEIDWMRTFMGNLGLQEYNAQNFLEDTNRTQRTFDEQETNVRERSEDISERVMQYLDEHSTNDFVPGPAQIIRDLNLRPTQKSSVHGITQRWLRNRNPWRTSQKPTNISSQ